MKKLFVFLLATMVTTAFAVEPENISILKHRLISYHDSGEYNYDLSAVSLQAQDYLLWRVKQNQAEKKPKKLAIVLDIDETALSNYNYLLHNDFGINQDTVNQDMVHSDETVIAGTYKLYQLAMDNHVAVFFVTGRPESYRKGTEKNLTDHGYKQWTKLYLRANDFHGASTADYKMVARHEIINQGYDIILNMGDQYSDLKGGYADRVFKLPDPFYYVP